MYNCYVYQLHVTIQLYNYYMLCHYVITLQIYNCYRQQLHVSWCDRDILGTFKTMFL